MKINAFSNTNRQYQTQRISLALLFQQYCLNPEQLFTLVVRGSTMCLYECQSNIFKQGVRSKQFNIESSAGSRRQENNLFATAISKIEANSRLDQRNEEGAQNNGYFFNSYRSKMSNKTSKVRKNSAGSKSPLKRKNNNNSNFREPQSPEYQRNQYVSNQIHHYKPENEQQQKDIFDDFKLDKEKQHGRNEKKDSRIGSNSYKIIHKTYSNLSNQNQQNILPIVSVNKNSIESRPFDSFMQGQSKQMHSQMNNRQGHHEVFELSFQNANNFHENYSAEPRIGQYIPVAPLSNAQIILQQPKKEEEKVQNISDKKQIKGQIKQSSKVNILISDSSSEERYISSQGNKNIKKSDKIILENFILLQNNAKKSIIQQLEGINSQHRMSRIQQKQEQNNPQSDKKQPPQCDYEHIINPYAQQTQRDKTQQKVNKYTDQQVCQIISSRKKAIIEKTSNIGGVNKNQLSPLERQLLDMSDLDINALLKIEENQKEVKECKEKSEMKQHLVQANIPYSEQKISEPEIKIYLHKSKEITPCQPTNLLAPKSSKITSKNLISSFIPHYLLQQSPKNFQSNLTTSCHNNFLLQQGEFCTAKTTESHVYEVSANANC